MNPATPSLRLITCLGIGAYCSLGGIAMAHSDAPGQQPPPYTTSTAQAPRLLATFVHAQAERSLAIVSQADAASQTLHVGQEVGNGLRLHTIAHGHVVVARGPQLFTLRLLGQGSARKPNRPRAAGTGTGAVDAAISSNGGAILRADNLDAVRAACSDPATVAALPDAQKAELAALGLCNVP